MEIKHTTSTEITISLHPAHAEKLAETLYALLSHGLTDFDRTNGNCPNEHLIWLLNNQLNEILGK